MIKVSKYLSCLIATLVLSSSVMATDIDVSFVDEKWNGKVVPLDEVCSDYNIEAGSTPGLYIENLPAGAKKIILKFNDKTFTKMDNGGHGVLSYKIEDETSNIEIPPQYGETFDLNEGFEVVTAHTGTRFNKKAGAYLPPCSGGKGNTYTVDISIVDEENNILSTKEVVLGKY